jgi:hypothetical protein
VTRRLLLLPAGLLLLAACSGGGQEAASSSPAPTPSPSASSASPAPTSASPSPTQESILAVLCDSATDEQIAIIEAAMKPGYTVTKLVDVRTREGGQHALLGIIEGPDVSGMARWIGSKMALEGLESADQAAADSSTAPLMASPSQDAIDYLNQTATCFEAIYDEAPE